MNCFQFVRPSLGRVVGMTIAAIALVCVIAGIVLYIGLIATHHDDGPTPTGDYIHLFFVSILFYAPNVPSHRLAGHDSGGTGARRPGRLTTEKPTGQK